MCTTIMHDVMYIANSIPLRNNKEGMQSYMYMVPDLKDIL